MGYHINKIKKGIYGESSKILEEIHELQDAELQKNKILALVEISDLLGAVEGYLERHYPFISLNDVIKMADLTRSAFQDGTRK
jgi:hypothetical protein